MRAEAPMPTGLNGLEPKRCFLAPALLAGGQGSRWTVGVPAPPAAFAYGPPKHPMLKRRARLPTHSPLAVPSHPRQGATHVLEQALESTVGTGTSHASKWRRLLWTRVAQDWGSWTGVLGPII